MWGKVKTVTQMGAIIFGIALLYFAESILPMLNLSGDVAVNLINVLYIVYCVLLWVSTVVAVISGAIYMKDSFEFIDPSK